MRLDPALAEALAGEANLAPSVHNTQPTRWRVTSETTLLALEDSTRRLAVGDPEGRDIGVSHGCAIEGLVMAAAARGLGAVVLPDEEGIARITFETGGDPDPFGAQVTVRRTFRGKFAPAPTGALDRLSTSRDDVTIVTSHGAIADLARLYDEASLRWFRRAPYRAELVSWMRLSKGDPNWSLDGLNAEAMQMSGLAAAGAGLVLRPGVFEALDRVGLAGALTAEAPVVKSASFVVLFHRPEGEAPVTTGRHFYRMWLEIAAAGLSASPMAVLADDEAAARAVGSAFSLPEGRRLITALRVGRAPREDRSPKPRLPAAALFV